jgi:hypothetical protein
MRRCTLLSASSHARITGRSDEASDASTFTLLTRSSADTMSDVGPAFDAAATSVRRVFPVTSPPFLASGAKENKRFISIKAPNPASQAQREGERTINPSLSLKLHFLCKCANTTICLSPCASVLAYFHNHFLKGVMLALTRSKCICLKILT